LSSTSTGVPAQAATNAALDRPSYQYYVLFVLVLGYIFNVIDRGALGILLQPIKQELHLSDSALGLLTGPAFAVFYSVLGIPIARLADRWSRVNVLALAIGVWTAATALCGAAYNFTTLFIFRCTTGIGEAGGSPPSHSLISDYFSGSKRATALAVYAMAVPVGTAIGNFVAGNSNVSFGWRWTFVIVGAPGLIVALLAWLTIKEPPRGHSDAGNKLLRQDTPGFVEALKYLMTRRSFMHMSVAAAAHSVMWYAGSNWNPSFFVRAHGMNTGTAGNYLAIFALIGAIGSFAGGFLADRLSIRNQDRRWYMWVPAIACLAMVPFQFFAYLSPDMDVVVPTFTVMVVLASMFFGPSFAMGQSLATIRMRAMAASVLLFIQTMIGLTFGPQLVGLLSDYLKPEVGDATSLRYAMVIVGVSNIWAAFHYYMGSRTYRQDLEATARLNAAGPS
jgi:MFS family permease